MRVPGCYHHLLLKEAAMLRRVLAAKCVTWQSKAASNGKSCGHWDKTGLREASFVN